MESSTTMHEAVPDTVHSVTAGVLDAVSGSAQAEAPSEEVARRAPAWITPAFFCSGFAALIYQVVWQRVLFANFGINIEAVTVVVTAFLLGLGFGSLFGGVLSTRGNGLLVMFGLLELSVGAYGVASVPLFHAVARLSVGMTGWETGTLTFLLVLAPTLLMGATLPLLVAFVVARTGNVGNSVGALYFVNTAGSAVAALVTALVVLRQFGEIRSVWLAAAINATVGTFVLIQSTRAGERL